MTPQRIKKLKDVISRRQKDLTVILENVIDAHNIAAILRSCDSVGINEVYLIFTDEVHYCKLGPVNPNPMSILRTINRRKKSSGHAKKWIDLHYFETTEACFDVIRTKYDAIYTTHLSEEATDLHSMDFTKSMALVFGNEQSGLSQTAVTLSDGNFIVPQMGMTRSLNISVACAISLYEAYRQRKQAKMYDNPSFSNAEQAVLLEDWKSR
jgi:tRNA (guanosine-2'-O-)-methyltransferase